MPALTYNVKNLVPAQIVPDIVVFTGDGTVALPYSGVIILSKASAAAITLPVPTQDGLWLQFVTTTAQAHVVTASSVGFNGKGSSGTATLTAARGNGFVVVSYNGNWYSLASTGNTFA